MKTNRTTAGLLMLLALTTLNPQPSTVFGGQMFPIVTNDMAATGYGAACAGTNYLVGIQGDIVTINSYQITAQLFGPNGTPVGGRINPVPGHTGGNATVASSGTNFLMVWPDDYLEGNSSSISAQLISPSGALIGGMIAITTDSAQHSPGVVYGAGQYLVTWNDHMNGTNWNIFGQIVSANGALVGDCFLISAPVNGQRNQGASAAFDGTNFLVVWQFASVTNQYVTYGVFISPAGVVGTPFAIGQTVSPNVVAMDGGIPVFSGTNYFVVWPYDSGLGGTNPPIWNLYGRFVTPAGTFPGNEFPIMTNGNPIYSFPAFDGANYLLCWNPNFGATNSDVHCQFLNSSGQAMGSQFTPFSAQGSEVPLITNPLYDGKRFVLVTSLSADGTTPTNDAGIYGTFIPASTTPPQFCAGPSYGNQQFTLSLAGTPGINYAVQMTTNLPASSWMPLVTNSPTNGTFTFTDPGATNKSRFYRAVKQ
jgi:hypothetical protein